jgi:hypothetical protein
VPGSAPGAGAIVPVRHLSDDRTKVEVDRDARVSASQARRAEGHENWSASAKKGSKRATPENADQEVGGLASTSLRRTRVVSSTSWDVTS